MSKIITDMQNSGEVVHIVSANQAQPLIKDGYVRQVNIQPTPSKGEMAISLTTKGRGYTAPTPAPTPSASK